MHRRNYCPRFQDDAKGITYLALHGKIRGLHHVLGKITHVRRRRDEVDGKNAELETAMREVDDRWNMVWDDTRGFEIDCGSCYKNPTSHLLSLTTEIQ